MKCERCEGISHISYNGNMSEFARRTKQTPRKHYLSGQLVFRSRFEHGTSPIQSKSTKLSTVTFNPYLQTPSEWSGKQIFRRLKL